MNDRTPAVIYAAKSTEDKHGSIPTQFAGSRELAEREERQVIGEFSDEGFSAYSGNRGPGLEQACRAAAEAAPSVLIAQHSDRIARGAGDAPGASRHLSEFIDWAIRNRVTIRTVQDDFYADPRTARLMAAAMGQRNFEDSERKSRSVKDGLKRRKEDGKPVGPVPLGYVAKDGARVIDPESSKTTERIFDLVESGSTFGDVARTLNAEGITTRRGGTWVSRTVRNIIFNDAYAGRKGYPVLIEPERFDAIHANLARLDPVQVASRKGGRKPADESFFLRGVSRCLRCGATHYTRRYAVGRVYVCANVRQGTGLCHAPPIPAELIESHVLRHLDSFVGSVEDWIAAKLKERDRDRLAREASLDRARVHLTALDGKREKYLTEYRKLVDEGATTAYIALDEVERIDRERAEQERLITEAEAIIGEWSGAPDVDSALDFYGALVDLVQGRIQKAEGAADLNRALRQVLAGLWAEIEEHRDRLLVEFELVNQPESVLPGGEAIMFEQRPTLPPRSLEDRMEPEPLRQTETQTLV